MDRLVEMDGLEKIRDAIERFVVDQNRAQQSLFGLDIVRGRFVLGFGFGRDGRQPPHSFHDDLVMFPNTVLIDSGRNARREHEIR